MHGFVSSPQDTLGETAADFADDLNVFYFTSRATDDALADSISGEVVLFVITCKFRPSDTLNAPKSLPFIHLLLDDSLRTHSSMLCSVRPPQHDPPMSYLFPNF